MSDAPLLNLEPLKVTCTTADCEHDLHCFKFLSRKMKPADRGSCRYCGASLVDWERLHQRRAADVENTFSALQQEFIRHHFWHVEIDEKADKHARRKGKLGLREAAYTRVLKSVGSSHPPRDGQQTPFKGNVLFYAQHATACCCRTCMEYWHGIPKGVQLTPQQLEYFTELVMRFVSHRMPELGDLPERVPRSTVAGRSR